MPNFQNCENYSRVKVVLSLNGKFEIAHSENSLHCCWCCIQNVLFHDGAVWSFRTGPRLGQSLIRFKRQSSKTSQPVGPFLGPGGYCCALQYGSVRSNKRPSALLLLPLVTPSFFSYSEQMVRLRAPANVRKSVFLWLRNWRAIRTIDPP